MNPLVFFVIVMVIDLFLKSSKDKKKIEEARRKRNEQINRQPMEKKRDLITILNEELEKRIDRPLETRPMDRNRVKKAKAPDVTRVTSDIDKKEPIVEEELDRDIYKKVPDVEKQSKIKIEVKEDILRGIIFSEILSEPKGRQHMKRSM